MARVGAPQLDDLSIFTFHLLIFDMRTNQNKQNRETLIEASSTHYHGSLITKTFRRDVHTERRLCVGLIRAAYHRDRDCLHDVDSLPDGRVGGKCSTYEITCALMFMDLFGTLMASALSA